MKDMGIREKEDKLFNNWMNSKKRYPFIMDGVVFPEKYLSAKTQIVFILKDANLKISAEDRKNGNFNESFHDQRITLGTNPGKWWKKLRNWCVPISQPGVTWDQVLSSDIKESLSSFAFMQLKKNAGGGSVSSKELWKVAESDSLEIIEQLSIYKPNIIIGCGVGEIVYRAVFQGGEKMKVTGNGVGYWNVKIGEDGKEAVLINYSHPSARYGKKLESVVAYGLAAAVSSLSAGSNPS